MTDTAPRIYVACLASYNSGILYGKWIEATSDADAMSAEIQEMLAGSPCPNVMRQRFTDEEGATRYVDVSIDPANGVQPDGWVKVGEPYASAEEWAIHDYEGLGGDLGEYAGLAEVARRVAIIELADDRDIPANVLLAFAGEYMSGEWDADDLGDKLDDAYDGSAQSWKEFCESRSEDIYSEDLEKLPDWLRFHIDWEGIARDWELGGDWSAYQDGDGGDLYFFRTC